MLNRLSYPVPHVPLIFTVITGIVGLLSTIFVTVIYFAFFLLLVFPCFSAFFGFNSIFYDSIFSPSLAYQLCFLSYFVKKLAISIYKKSKPPFREHRAASHAGHMPHKSIPSARLTLMSCLSHTRKL